MRDGDAVLVSGGGLWAVRGRDWVRGADECVSGLRQSATVLHFSGFRTGVGFVAWLLECLFFLFPALKVV